MQPSPSFLSFSLPNIQLIYLVSIKGVVCITGGCVVGGRQSRATLKSAVRILTVCPRHATVNQTM
jgi:hypothetical protein